MPSRGARASRIAGTALVVESKTVVALRNQVDVRASSAKFGKRAASILPSGPSEVVHRELVEHQQHDGRLPAGGRGGAVAAGDREGHAGRDHEQEH